MRDKKKEPKPKKEWPLGTDEKREEEKDLPPQMRSVPYVGMTKSDFQFRFDREVAKVIEEKSSGIGVLPPSDTFVEKKCPLNSNSHSEHDKALFLQEQEVRKLSAQVTDLERQLDDAETSADLRFHNEEEKLKRRIKELEESQVIIPEAEKDRTNQVLAQRVYELQKQNSFLREKLKAKQEAP